EPPAPSDGQRILVDRLWPRGLKKADAKLDRWMKEVAPSTALRAWFGNKPERFAEFRKRYARRSRTTPLWPSSASSAAATPSPSSTAPATPTRTRPPCCSECCAGGASCSRLAPSLFPLAPGTGERAGVRGSSRLARGYRARPACRAVALAK